MWISVNLMKVSSPLSSLSFRPLAWLWIQGLARSLYIQSVNSLMNCSCVILCASWAILKPPHICAVQQFPRTGEKTCPWFRFFLPFCDVCWASYRTDHNTNAPLGQLTIFCLLLLRLSWSTFTFTYFMLVLVGHLPGYTYYREVQNNVNGTLQLVFEIWKNFVRWDL